MKVTIIDGPIYARIAENAAQAELGGMSHVRRGHVDRQEKLAIDQLVGQLGEFALCRFLGDEQFYFERRSTINQDPLRGDEGFDWKTAIDVKTSLMRRSKDPLSYRLAVRPRERHDENVYVLALLADTEVPVKVWLVGWAYDRDLLTIETEGVFEGAFTILARNLRDMSTLNAN